MFVHAKQSGELLCSQADDSQLWTPIGVRRSAEKLAAAHKDREKLNIEGLLVVSGAGNIIRGNALKPYGIASGLEDFLGRLATVQNNIVLARRLEELKVPVKVFISDNMAVCDPSLPTDYLEPYDTEAVLEAYQRERMVLIAGGTGEDNKTTDNAVMEYARRHKVYDSAAELLVLKGTKEDGVFEDDPRKVLNARRYRTINARYMLDNYSRFKVVDQACLEQIDATGIAMRIYADGQHDLQFAISMNNGDVGTLVTGGDAEPVFAA